MAVVAKIKLMSVSVSHIIACHDHINFGCADTIAGQMPLTSSVKQVILAERLIKRSWRV